MRTHTSLDRRRESATVAVLLALTTAILLGLCTPAVALRPRTTPAHAALLAAAIPSAGDGRGRRMARHDAAISRMVARHDAAGNGGSAVFIAARDRRHPPTALTSRGALAVASFAAIAAIALVLLAVVTGRRESAREARLARRWERTRTRPATDHRIAA